MIPAPSTQFGIPGAPDHELWRSPAAAWVGQHAAASGLRLAHFEHRHHLPTPEHWLPENRADLLAPASGHLAEHKYGQHRNDGLVGSFNPAHLPKWTAHELCHGLAGFAWRPGATPLFHALSARLSEVVPVALWYFFDEVGLCRCPEHADEATPLTPPHARFARWCSACETAARLGPRAPTERDGQWQAAGLAFIRAELASVATSRRQGLPHHHRTAHLDLMSDALAYATSHRGRLDSPEFRRYIEYFHASPHTGHLPGLEAMMAHVEGLGDALAHGSPWTAWTLTPAQVVAQDVGWRLLQVAADCEGEAATLLDDLAQRLASDAESLPGVIEAYEVACDDWWLPSAAEVFALGYALPRGHGRSTEGLARALGDAMPGTEALLDESLPAHLVAFAQEPPTRGPLPRRLAAWLAAGTPGPVAEVARYEAACADPQPADEATDSLGEGEGEPIAASGIEVLEFTVDPTLLLQALEDESVAEDDAERPTILAIRQRAGGEVVVAEINAAAAAFLVGSGPWAALPLDEQASLTQLGFTRPGRWTS